MERKPVLSNTEISEEDRLTIPAAISTDENSMDYETDATAGDHGPQHKHKGVQPNVSM